MNDVPYFRKKNSKQPKESSNIFGNLKEGLTVLTLIAGLIGTYFAHQSQKAATEAASNTKNLDDDLKKNADERAKIDLEGKYNLAAFEAVMKLIDARNGKDTQFIEQKEQAVLSLINSTAKDPLKSSLLEIINMHSRSLTIKESAKESADFYRVVGEKETKQVELDKGKIKNGTSNLDGFRVDIFYCEQAEADNKIQAQSDNVIQAEPNYENIATALNEELRKNLEITTRLKKLLKITNSSPGYNIDSNQIRYEVPGEVNAAFALRNILQKITIADGKTHQFEMVQVKNQTNRYLSVFVCNG
ncbi:hypothetical protein [Methylophilus methylotrophus]|uniref:hypothetical protein n=1 Tax=Methylophilus methylotrophus TaxID=17 RepID=UPI000F5945D2|nr:hypothetical protein [Methylophilus methylotrophus]